MKNLKLIIICFFMLDFGGVSPVFAMQKENCVICCDSMETDQDIVNLSCSEKHCFHRECIKQCIDADHMACPICRASISYLDQLNIRTKRIQQRNTKRCCMQCNKRSAELVKLPRCSHVMDKDCIRMCIDKGYCFSCYSEQYQPEDITEVGEVVDLESINQLLNKHSVGITLSPRFSISIGPATFIMQQGIQFVRVTIISNDRIVSSFQKEKMYAMDPTARLFFKEVILGFLIEWNKLVKNDKKSIKQQNESHLNNLLNQIRFTQNEINNLRNICGKEKLIPETSESSIGFDDSNIIDEGIVKSDEMSIKVPLLSKDWAAIHRLGYIEPLLMSNEFKIELPPLSRIRFIQNIEEQVKNLEDNNQYISNEISIKNYLISFGLVGIIIYLSIKWEDSKAKKAKEEKKKEESEKQNNSQTVK